MEEVTIAGIFGAQLGWRWADPVAGVVVALLILRTAWHIGVEAAHALMDGFDTKVLDDLRIQVAAVEGVVQICDIRARHQGNSIAVDLTITVAPHLGVEEAHAISERVEGTLLEGDTVQFVHVHVEPAAPGKKVR